MMRLLDTLVARLILVSLLGITLVHVLSIWSYEKALERELGHADEARLAERIQTIRRSIAAVSAREREALAHDLSSGPLEAHWNRTRGTAAGGKGAERWRGLVERLRVSAGELAPDDIVLGTGDDPHNALLSIRLPDSTWLNVSLFAASRSGHGGHGTLLSTSIMAAGVVLMSLLIAGWLTRPLRSMASAVSALSPDGPRSEIAEEGPREVRQLASAFNDMQTRIGELIDRRTQALAAVSHDLRTPLTRLKLRLSDIGDLALQKSVQADLAEMEAMIEATLAYLRGQETQEPPRPIDLAALLATVVDEARDAGHDAVLIAPPPITVTGRHLGLKRALTNLAANAVRFGTKVEVRAAISGAVVAIEIADNGPGIPVGQLDAVFEPFVRLETSRNRESGGVGLGLTIAKACIEADRGTLTLANRPEGGLVAVIRLPRQPA
ncbi:MAG TPA: ATP-binding protein [Hyphomicrobiaceae bacterium]|nr:ATP-binding protein [Hyphomicrobiaceae bacterium]